MDNCQVVLWKNLPSLQKFDGECSFSESHPCKCKSLQLLFSKNYCNWWITAIAVVKSGVEISFFCLTGHFCCWRTQIAVHLLQLRVLLVRYFPCFLHLSLEAFPISTIRKCLISRKSTFSNLFYSIFSLKIPSCIAFLLPTPLKSKRD